mmetsp:Transcript_31518/g.60768  ORF Transcript_31518/g.60768 Transcript_31518/m.60768 type:complete len:194 (-) Transcript_31518:271-852(-)
MPFNFNVKASAFVPSSSSRSTDVELPSLEELESACYSSEPTVSDLEELRAVDEWVETMADLAQLEESHLINMALQHADETQLQDIRNRANLIVSAPQQVPYAKPGEIMYYPYMHQQDIYQQQGTFYAPDSSVINEWMLSHGKGGVETPARCTQHKSCQKAGRSCMHHAPRNTVRAHSNSVQHNHARQQMTRIN